MNMNNMNNLGNSKKGKPKYLISIIMLIFIYIAIPVGCAYYIYNILRDKENMDWNPDVEDDVKIKRTQNRGTLISIFLMGSAFVQAFMKVFGASSVM